MTGECCKINAIVSVDAKGQVVLPKDLREKANIRANDKLAAICLERNGEVCCIVMLKAEALGSTLRNMLGPVFKEIFQEEVEK